MELAAGWTTIVGCPVGGRDVILFYDEQSGKTQTAYIDWTGKGVPLKTFGLSPGWSQIAFCNGRLLFFNESTGVAAIATIGRDGAFHQNAVLTTFGGDYADRPNPIGRGLANIISDGHHLFISREKESLVCRITPPYIGEGDGQNFSALIIRVLSSYPEDQGPWYNLIVAGSGMLVGYSSAYRLSANIWFGWIDAGGDMHTLYPISESDPNWMTIVVSNGFLMFYDSGVGGGKIVTASPDYWLEDLPWKSAAISPNWSHLVPVGARLLFYAQYNGDARVGHITPNGDFSGETKF